MGKVYIVGAGPGDPELLTLKALKAIKKADVILYDRLINPEILLHAKPGCELVYVGKEDGKHILEQDKINFLLYEFAKSNEIVVRLKGGDPFVFGRGGEEAIFLKEKGIPFEIVPGITSAISVPLYAGVPVTHRGVASSFVVVTGHGSKGQFPDINWKSLVGIDTVIFLMGIANRQKIAENLIKAGKSPETPVIFIEKGTTKEQKEIESTLEEVAQGKVKVHPPAIFLVGEVVRLRGKINWFEEALGEVRV
ncbi:uroporphyrin-III C-methyltransferase [Persephonella hydrogeniphila]|uniref:uroporphyrinogen-III C-methyltransferase n=1 Tax=Persephonella hydrogeniphila TaxID=198703 RepID=A0A285NLI1_9AQUI|nr:uroporphyrinogen-III C-methyltransferase [Persephonella hydrogeniphila]SNZ10352.1 uroporphyrin-III C-methyltransferase [Persephonella hydrogeniphila]